MQDKFNVQINVSKDANSDGTKNVEIRGNELSGAEDAIHEICNKFSSNRQDNNRYDRPRESYRKAEPKVEDDWDVTPSYTSKQSSNKPDNSSRFDRSQDRSRKVEPKVEEDWDDTTSYTAPKQSTKPANRVLDHVNVSDNWDHIENNEQDYVAKPKRYEYKQSSNFNTGNGGSSGRWDNNRSNTYDNSSYGSRGSGYKRTNDDRFGDRRRDYNSKSSYDFNSQYSSFQEVPKDDEPMEIDWDTINKRCVSSLVSIF